MKYSVANGEVRVGVAGTPRDGQVLPLSPNRFVSPDIDGLQVEFHQDARGQVNALSVVHGQGRARYGHALLPLAHVCNEQLGRLRTQLWMVLLQLNSQPVVARLGVFRACEQKNIVEL